MSNDDIPVVAGVPAGLIIYRVQLEDNQGGTELKAMAAPSLTECALAIDTWAKARGMAVRWIAEDGWEESLV